MKAYEVYRETNGEEDCIVARYHSMTFASYQLQRCEKTAEPGEAYHVRAVDVEAEG